MLKMKLFFLEEVKSLRSVIIQLAKAYKKLPNFVLTVADIQKHPSYNTFIDCVAKHNIPLLSPALNPQNIKEEFELYLKKINNLASNLLFKKQPQEFLHFSYFINDVYSCYKYFLEKLDFIDTTKAIQNVALYLNNTTASINQNLFQGDFSYQPYKTKNFKKVIWISIGSMSTMLGIIFTANIFKYKNIISEYKQELFTIPNKPTEVIQTTNLSKDSILEVKSKLIDSFLYPDKMLEHGIYVNESVKIQHQLLELLENSSSSENSIDRTFVFLMLIAPQNVLLQNLIKSNIKIWSLVTNIPEDAITTYVSASVPKLNVNIATKDLNDLTYQDLFVNTHVYEMAKSYVVDNSTVNLRTLHIFLEEIDLPVAKQQVINIFMEKIFPKMKNSLSEYNREFLENLYNKIKDTTKTSGELKDIKGLVPLTSDTGVDNLQAALDLLEKTNKQLKKHLPNDLKITKPSWYKVIMQAVYNDIMNNLVLSKPKLLDKSTIKQFVINVADNGSYYGNISMLYTKIGLKEIVLPEISSYKKVINLLKKHGINSSAINNYYNNALQTYIHNYKESYIKLITSYKHSINLNDIVSSLLLISSTSSQFNNMLKTLVKNTTFDKEAFKEIPQLSVIDSYFQNVNKMISNPNDINQYNQIIRNIANEINNSNDKADAINKITLNLYTKSKESYLCKVNSLLKKNNISEENSIIFTAPLKNIMNFGKPYLIKYKSKLWKKDIESIIDKQKGRYPFSENLNKIASPKELTEVFGPKGKFWKTVEKDMYGIFEYKNEQWTAKIPDLFGSNTQNMISTLNSVQKLTNSLWDKSGKPKPLDITLNIMPTPNTLLANDTFIKMTILSAGNEKVIGISTEQKPITLKYKWFEQQSSSVGYIDNHDQINSIEIHSSYWSFLKLLDKANKDSDTYTWKQNNVAIKFKIQFNNVFKMLNEVNIMENM
ncbi:cation-binding protein [Allofrancisella guangzhouensis]|uniref:cation-binding protein n=1 Tax=Allofrancisella guangzhouensis TaxID=594679 RepID=UPI001F299A3D|nr:cation-binding protein [Allofrancisella guangzhouensis]